jgi:hypothetical protein
VEDAQHQGSYPAEPPSSAVRARRAILFLRLVAAFILVGAAVELVLTITVESPAAFGREPVSAIHLAIFGFGVLFFFVLTATPVVFLMWLYRAKNRERWFETRRPTVFRSSRSTSPVWAVVVWFIPMVSLVAPYYEIANLFAHEEEGSTDRPPPLAFWWGCLVASGVIGCIATFWSGRSTFGGRSPAFNMIEIASRLLLALAAFLAARIIAEYERRTARRSEGLAAMATAPSPLSASKP